MGKIDFDGFSMNVEINEIVFASYVVGILIVSMYRNFRPLASPRFEKYVHSRLFGISQRKFGEREVVHFGA